MAKYEKGTLAPIGAIVLALAFALSAQPAQAACTFGAGQYAPVFDASSGLIKYCSGSTITDAVVAASSITAPGSTTQVVYNNAGALAGAANMTWTVGTSTLAVTGIVTATTFSGSGASLTNIPTTALTGTLASAQFPALTGVVTTSAGSLATTITAGAVTNAMLAGSIDLATKVTGLLPAASLPALTGDVTTLSGALATTIASSAVTNAKMANMANNTIKGNVSGGVAAPSDLTATQATALLNVLGGDSGSGGTKGLVPAPAAGDTAANKYLKADGTWSAVSTSSSTISQGDSNVTVTDAGTGSITLATDAVTRFTIGTSLTSGTAALELNGTGTGNRYAFIDFHGDDTYTDYGLRIIRDNAGANSTSSLYHRGTGNFSVATQDAASLLLSTSGTERMRIDSAGLVGIGTTAPLAALSVGAGSLTDVNVPIQISSAGTDTSRWLGVNKNGAYGLLVGYNEAAAALGGVGSIIRSVDTNPLGFVVNNTSRAMTILSSGYVGIGTASPGSLLTLSGSAVPTMQVAANASALYGAFLELNATAIAGGKAWRIFSTGASAGEGTGKLVFQNNTDSSLNAMTMTATGNVGIGTTGPSAKLGVTAGSLGTALNDSLELAQFSNLNGNADVLRVYKYRNTASGTGWDSATTRIQQRIDASDQGYLAFNPLGSTWGVAIGSGSTEIARFQLNGNVGIGTTAPARRLSVLGGTQPLMTGTNDFVSGSAGTMFIQEFGAATGNTSASIGVLTAGGTAWGNLNIAPGGAVGIGQATPTQKLHVGGVVRMDSDTATACNAAATGALRYNAGTFEKCDGGGTWTNFAAGGSNTISQGDSNVTVTDAGTGVITLATDASTRVTVNATGMGIGTAPSGAKLHVTGDIKVDNSAYSRVLHAVSGTTQWSVGTRDTNDYYIYRETGATNVLIPNGNLGIGTASPGGKLDVAGGRAFFSAASEQYAVGARYVSTGGAVYFGASSNAATPDAVISAAGGGALMTLQNGGNVGIGTASPQGKLAVAHGAGDGAATSANGIIFQQSSGWAHAAIWADGSSGFNGNLILATDGDGASNYNPTEKMRITAAGTVGIGTASPVNLLTISNPANQTDTVGNVQALYSGTNSAFNSGYTAKNYHGTSQFMQWTNLGLRLGSRIMTNSGAGSVYLTYGNDTVGMTIDGSNGNVGIGTTTPAQKLEVAGVIQAAYMLDRDNTGFTVDPSSISYMNDVRPSILYDRDNAGYYLDMSAGGRIAGVNIHGSTPTIGFEDTDHRTAYIHVNSNLFYVLRGCGSGASSWCSTGNDWPFYINLENNDASFGNNVYAYGYFHRSDARLKHDIKAFTRDPIAIVKGLQAVTFKWNATKKQDFGVIAQDVQKVLPEVVITDDRQQLVVNYDKLVLPLIEAVKRLIDVIEALQAKMTSLLDWRAKAGQEIAALQSQNAAMTARNAALEHQLSEQQQEFDRRLDALESRTTPAAANDNDRKPAVPRRRVVH